MRRDEQQDDEQQIERGRGGQQREQPRAERIHRRPAERIAGAHLARP